MIKLLGLERNSSGSRRYFLKAEEKGRRDLSEYPLKPLSKTLITLIVAMTLLFVPIPDSKSLAVDLSQSYIVMQRDYPEMIERLKAGGATDANIEAFLIDMENDLSQKGTLTEDNFDLFMYQSLENVITWRKHRTLYRALMDQFGEEIDYTLQNHKLHPDLVPIRNAIMEALLGGAPVSTRCYLLVVPGAKYYQIKIDWDGSGTKYAEEIITIRIDDGVILEAPPKLEVVSPAVGSSLP
jgi:hypothetical protein